MFDAYDTENSCRYTERRLAMAYRCLWPLDIASTPVEEIRKITVAA